MEIGDKYYTQWRMSSKLSLWQKIKIRLLGKRFKTTTKDGSITGYAHKECVFVTSIKLKK